ncbi:AAA family ATPase [Mycobacterium sp. IDR2000157661]|uniref:AAA family ATPase n=1 Tax=Mycobacterium sp. IDR2000157661 TaxID=2867005 RepID=UPI001EEC0E88|nr:AAA family ATPase [Mycobacterium sp. IDR2000157661]ULE35497.1 AAA family ATPase [Mycobacterium sp. IDR2000157661]
MTRGLVIGKFLPFHHGHRALIERAARRVDELDIIVCDAGWHQIPVERRAAWIDETCSGLGIRAKVLTVDGDRYDVADDDSAGWAAITLELLGRAPDVVFTGEDYGDAYAQALGCVHDYGEREPGGLSGTAVRAAPLAHLDRLDPPVRAHYVQRVSVVGAESTGKTTLADDLACRLGTVAVPEFGRHFTEAMPEPQRYRWSTRDFELITEVQERIEDDAARWSGPVLVCDTNPLVTAVFHEVYLGTTDSRLFERALRRTYHLYILCGVDTPFVQDSTGLRHDGEQRRAMHDRYRQLLAAVTVPWIEVSGDRNLRVRQAIAAIEPLLRAGGLDP